MVSATETVVHKSTQTSPRPTPKPLTSKQRQENRESSISIALSSLLCLVFFTLVIHACVRSIAVHDRHIEQKSGSGGNANDGPMLGAILSFIPVFGCIFAIAVHLDDVEPGLGWRTITNAGLAAVMGLAWVVFVVGESAEFRVYLDWVMWPVVAAFGLEVLRARVGVLRAGGRGVVEGKAEDGKG